MAGKHSGKKNRSARAKARGRALGLGGSAGAFLAFGLSPLAGLASAPPAHADGLDVIVDPIINSILSSVTSFDALLGIDPSSLGDLALPATDAAATAPSGWESLFGDFTNPVSDAGTAASLTDSTSSTWLQGLEQAWINSDLGQQVDTGLNSWFEQADPAASAAGGACGLICNGADGVGGGSLADATGQGGGIFFGNGGDGATDALGQGGAGGDALYFGNGGGGGGGGAGGEGGNAGLFFGNAGDGGNGGAGVAGGIGEVGGDGGAGGNAGTVGSLNFFGSGGDGGNGGIGGGGGGGGGGRDRPHRCHGCVRGQRRHRRQRRLGRRRRSRRQRWRRWRCHQGWPVRGHRCER